jgi:ribonuclease HII
MSDERRLEFSDSMSERKGSGSDRSFPLIGRHLEDEALALGFTLIAGVDEVGRGCLAGPVVAAACILNLSGEVPKGLNDSKKLSEKRRVALDEIIREKAVAFAIAEVSAEVIDQINILEATKRAMSIAIDSLKPQSDFLLLDAVTLKNVPTPQKSIIKGDATSISIAAASILAKNHRDRLMREMDSIYPGYGFAEHVGYGTKTHYEALRILGPTPIHRLTFKGVVPEKGLFD